MDLRRFFWGFIVPACVVGFAAYILWLIDNHKPTKK